jgi:hypothetical protein
MQKTRIGRLTAQNRPGYALLLMILLIVVIVVLVWLDPTALFRRPDPGLPWNQESRLVKAGERVPPPSQEQPQITRVLSFEAPVMKEDARRGTIRMGIRRSGRIQGTWTGEFYPDPNVNYALMGCTFEGNIDPSKVYGDQAGRDPSKLYFITRGKFIILSNNRATGKTKKVAGYIYLTGWLDSEHYAIADVTVTQNKKSYQKLSWKAKGKEATVIFDLFK